MGTAWYSSAWSYSKAESEVARLKAQSDKLVEEARTEFNNAREVVIRTILGYDSNMDEDVYRAKYNYLKSLISFEDFWGS